MGLLDRSLLDFNADGETDFMEWSVGVQMTASSRQEVLDLTGDDTFYLGNDPVEEENDDIGLCGLDPDDLLMKILLRV